MSKLKHFYIGFLAIATGIFVGIITYNLALAWSEKEPLLWSAVLAKAATIGICVGFVLSLINVVFGIFKLGQEKIK